MQGADASPVKAVANDGYLFVEWSDGNTSAERHDLAVAQSAQYTAKFRKISDTEVYIDLDYRGGIDKDGAVSADDIVFDLFDFKEQPFPVLTREHHTFGGWYIDDVMIADTDGKMTVDEEMFAQNPKGYFFAKAKWTADETFDYKVLLVYFEDVTVKYTSEETGEDLEKRYPLTEEKRQIYRPIAPRIKQKLDGLLDGLVDFQVDEYYVSSPISVKAESTSLSPLLGFYIPEVEELMDEYKVVISMSDYPEYCKKDKDDRVHGLAFGRTGCAEVFIDQARYKGELDYESIADTAIHELCHVIEGEVSLFPLHANRSSEDYFPYLDVPSYIIGAEYYNGCRVGVPYEYWTGGATYNVTYSPRAVHSYPLSVGKITFKPNGNCFLASPNYSTSAKVMAGAAVVAVASPTVDGYRFVMWSDGVTTPERTDVITADFKIEAIFEKIP
ncbi:MAG: hypothetical protein HFJ22_06155 [Clostridia bacterium]|nr:hypothetical protein [Clostridia bacterium]